MPSPNRLAYALLAAFVIFITLRGELRSYLGIMGLV
jgi:hypothetical protein